MFVRDVLASKGSSTVHTISPTATLAEVLDKLSELNIGALVVSSDARKVEGIISERDLIHALRDCDQKATQVMTVATSDVWTCELNDSVSDIAQAMTDRHVRHVPVVTNGQLSALLSIGDVVKHRIDQLQFERDQLSNYVAT